MRASPFLPSHIAVTSSLSLNQTVMLLAGLVPPPTSYWLCLVVDETVVHGYRLEAHDKVPRSSTLN